MSIPGGGRRPTPNELVWNLRRCKNCRLHKSWPLPYKNSLKWSGVPPANSATIGLKFRITGDRKVRGKRFVCSIVNEGPAMVLSEYKLQVGALLVSVNGDSSYNPDLIGSYCRGRPLWLEFSQPVYPALDETLRNTPDENNLGMCPAFLFSTITFYKQELVHLQVFFLNIGVTIQNLFVRWFLKLCGGEQ